MYFKSTIIMFKQKAIPKYFKKIKIMGNEFIIHLLYHKSTT